MTTLYSRLTRAIPALIFLAFPAAPTVAHSPVIKVGPGGDVPNLYVQVINNTDTYIVGSNYNLNSSGQFVPNYGPTAVGERRTYVAPHSSGLAAVNFQVTEGGGGNYPFALCGVGADGSGQPDTSGAPLAVYTSSLFVVNMDLCNESDDVCIAKQTPMQTDFQSGLTVTIAPNGSYTVTSDVPDSFTAQTLPSFGTNSAGQSSITIAALNAFGQIAGTAATYNASHSPTGYTAFLYSSGTVTVLGQVALPGTDSAGKSISSATALNDSGDLLGSATRYDSAHNPDGRTAFVLHSKAGTVTFISTLGQFGTDSTGQEINTPVALNAAGQAVGIADTYDSSHNYSGETGFLYTPGASSPLTDIGSLGNFGSDSGGDRFCYPVALNADGQVLGTADTYDSGHNYAGEIAFRYTPGARLPFLDVSNFGSGDAASSLYGMSFNSVGQALGNASLSDSAHNYLGETAFLDTNGATTRISGTAAGLNNDGEAIVNTGSGTSAAANLRYADGSLFALPYPVFETSVDTTAVALNDSGSVMGNADISKGTSAFLYSDATGWTTPIYNISDFGSDSSGNESSTAVALNQNGLMIGNAATYNANHNSTGQTAFVSGYDAVVDLAPYLPGWTNLSADAINARGQVAGVGTLNGAQRAFLLTPAYTTWNSEAVAALTLGPAGVIGGSGNFRGTLTLNGPAPAGGEVVAVSSSNPAALSLLSKATFGAGQTSFAVGATSHAVTVPTVVVITATAAGVSKRATVTVNPVPAALSTMTVSPAAVVGSSANAVVTLTLKSAVSVPTVVALSSSAPNALSVASSVTIAAHVTSGTFIATSHAVSSAVPVTLKATWNGVVKVATVTVNPVPAALLSLSVSPATLTGGGGATGTVTLKASVSTATVVTLHSSNTSLMSVPAAVTVARGYTSQTFPVTTHTVTKSTNVTCTAALNGVTKIVTLTLKP